MSILKTDYLRYKDNTYEIIPPVPTETERGGIIASAKTEIDTIEVKIGSNGKAYVSASPVATTSANGLMSSSDKSKLDKLPSPTTSDNDKILSVANGTWSLITVTNAEGVKY